MVHKPTYWTSWRSTSRVPTNFDLRWFLTDCTMEFITIFHHHLGDYFWVTFSIGILSKTIQRKIHQQKSAALMFRAYFIHISRDFSTFIVPWVLGVFKGWGWNWFLPLFLKVRSVCTRVARFGRATRNGPFGEPGGGFGVRSVAGFVFTS